MWCNNVCDGGVDLHRWDTVPGQDRKGKTSGRCWLIQGPCCKWSFMSIKTLMIQTYSDPTPLFLCCQLTDAAVTFQWHVWIKPWSAGTHLTTDSNRSETGHEQLISGPFRVRDIQEYDPYFQFQKKEIMPLCLTRYPFHAWSRFWHTVDFHLDPVMKLKCVLWICMKMFLC